MDHLKDPILSYFVCESSCIMPLFLTQTLGTESQNPPRAPSHPVLVPVILPRWASHQTQLPGGFPVEVTTQAEQLAEGGQLGPTHGRSRYIYIYIDILRWFRRDLYIFGNRKVKLLDLLIFAIFSEVIFQRNYGKLKLFTAKSRGFLANFHNNSGRMVGICWIWKGPLIAMWFSMGKHGHLGPNLEWWYSPLNGHFKLVLNVGNGWVAGGCWEDYYDVKMDHSRKISRV